MKFLPLFVIMAFLSACSTSKNSQVYEPGCSSFYVDVEEGTLNGINPTASMNDVKRQFPCFTGDTEEGSSFNCGGGVFDVDHNFYFYTGRDYIEVRYGFTGTMSDNLISLGEDEIKSKLGEPENIVEGGTQTYKIYKMKYGALVVTFRTGKVYQIAMHASKPDKVEICR